MPIVESDSRYFIVSGGRGSGKSFSVNALLVMLTYEQGHTILFTRYTLTSAYISIIPEFIDKLEQFGSIADFHITKDEIINKKTGSKIIFRGIKTSSGDQTANLKSLQGITTWVVDEAEELVDEQKFDTIDLSVRQQGKPNRIILILNPTTKEHFIYRRFFEDRGVQEGSNITKENTTYIHTTYQDNIDNLSKSYIDQIEQMKVRRPEKYKQQMLGAWLNKAEGVIFNNWSVGEFKHIGTSVWGQDYGFAADPSTLVEVNIDSSNKRIYLKECFYLQRLTTSQIAQLNLKHAREGLIVGDSAEPRLLSEIKAKGCNVRPSIKGQGSVTYGISLLQDYDIIVSPDSTNLIKELNNYRKDMGGAAHVLGLAKMIMASNMPVRLRVLVPAVENAIGGSAFRPQDILKSRKGLTVEINNTDAEGRLVLADALTLADESPCDVMICMATLTGAARVAVGPDIAPYFTQDNGLSHEIATAAAEVNDPVWQLPLHAPYEAMIEPGIADLDNAPAGGFAGAITAALFLQRFVTQTQKFVHFDCYGWQPSAAPARPKGGVGQGTRALFHALPRILNL